MNIKLTHLAQKLDQATTPEDVFGEFELIKGDWMQAVKKKYHSLARIAHPDTYHDAAEQSLAKNTFQKLSDWLIQAKKKIAAGTYGDRTKTVPTIVLQSRKREYHVHGNYTSKGIYNLYPCNYQEYGLHYTATLKVTRDSLNNDLASHEVQVLKALVNGKESRKFSAYVPRLLDAFLYESVGGSRQALVMEKEVGWYSLAEVKQAYPAGLHPKDMAWIFRRLLVALGFAHINEIVHAAVLPQNIWIHPEQHGLQLHDWTQYIDPAYENWYPHDTWAALSPQTDNYLAAKSIIYMLGGDPLIKSIPAHIPQPIRAFLLGSTTSGKGAPQDAWALKEEFDELLENLWGERKFHPFHMPTN